MQIKLVETCKNRSSVLFFSSPSITFFRYNCNTTVAKGRLLISPGDLTHIYHVNPVSNGKFEFVSSKFGGGDVLCQEIHGKGYCPGFDYNLSNMEK